MSSGLHVKYPSFVLDFNETWIWWTAFWKNTYISNFMKIRKYSNIKFRENPKILKYQISWKSENTRISNFMTIRKYSNIEFHENPKILAYKISWKSENARISNFMKIRSVGAELLHAVRRTDITKLIVAFRNFANALKNEPSVLYSEIISVFFFWHTHKTHKYTVWAER